MVEVKPLRIGIRCVLMCSHRSQILPVWLSLMCLCWEAMGQNNNTSEAETLWIFLDFVRPELWLAVFAAWVGLRRLCSARCG